MKSGLAFLTGATFMFLTGCATSSLLINPVLPAAHEPLPKSVEKRCARARFVSSYQAQRVCQRYYEERYSEKLTNASTTKLR